VLKKDYSLIIACNNNHRVLDNSSSQSYAPKTFHSFSSLVLTILEDYQNNLAVEENQAAFEIQVNKFL